VKPANGKPERSGGSVGCTHPGNSTSEPAGTDSKPLRGTLQEESGDLGLFPRNAPASWSREQDIPVGPCQRGFFAAREPSIVARLSYRPDTEISYYL
jgi:hypothetical protein